MASVVTYDPTTGNYLVNGAVASAAAVQAAAQAAVQTAQGTISSLSLQFQQGAINYQAWYSGMQIEIANMAAAQTALAHGGFASMDAAAWQRAVDVANNQLAYFDNFAAQVVPPAPFGQRELNRAAMYADAGRATYENERMTTQKGMGATEAQRVLGASDSCPDCIAWEALGWIPIEDMESDYPIGASVCLVNCFCSIVVR